MLVYPKHLFHDRKIFEFIENKENWKVNYFFSVQGVPLRANKDYVIWVVGYICIIIILASWNVEFMWDGNKGFLLRLP